MFSKELFAISRFEIKLYFIECPKKHLILKEENVYLVWYLIVKFKYTYVESCYLLF